MPNRRASAVVVPPGSPGAQQARFPGGSRSTEVCRGADAPRQYVRVPPKCDTWSVHRHASRLKSKEEPGVVLKKRNAAPGVHVIVPTASEHQPTTYQPPEALRRAAESAAHSRQETSARGLPPTSPLTGASPGTSSGCGTQATETIRTHPPLRQPRSQGPSGPDAERGPPRLCISSIYYLGCTCVPVPCPLSGAVGFSPLKKTILTLRGGGTCKKTGTLCTKAAALGRARASAALPCLSPTLLARHAAYIYRASLVGSCCW